jgi:hypothetical protein
VSYSRADGQPYCRGCRARNNLQPCAVLIRHQRDWRGLIAAELRHAADTGGIADLDTDLAAFQIDAVLMAANTGLRLGEVDAVDRVRRVVEGFLTPPR